MSGFDGLDKKMPILIVDDFSTMRRVIKNCLKQLGFENVTEAEDGQAALSKLQSQPFQFVVSDWNMPNMMGLELLHAIRADNKLKSIPFLMVTAASQKESVVEAENEGVSNYIVKPFTPTLLQTKMEEIFGK